MNKLCCYTNPSLICKGCKTYWCIACRWDAGKIHKYNRDMRGITCPGEQPVYWIKSIGDTEILSPDQPIYGLD